MTGKKAKPFFELNKSYEVSDNEINIGEDLEFITHAFLSHQAVKSVLNRKKLMKNASNII